MFCGEKMLGKERETIMTFHNLVFFKQTFVRYALRAKSIKDLTEAANKFIDGSVMLPPGNWKTDLLIPVAGAISEISRKKQLMRKFKHREGKDLWRIVRSKLLVIRMMKGLIQANVIKDQNEKVSEETTKEEKHHATTFFPRRGDCPTKTRFRKNSKWLSIFSVFTNNYIQPSFNVVQVFHSFKTLVR